MTPSEFIALLPEFTNVPVPRIQRALNLSGPHFDVARWDTFYSEGLSNWVAHEIVTTPAEGESAMQDDGDLSVMMVGSVRIERAAVTVEREMTDPIYSTRYGRRYARLRDLVKVGGTVSP